MHVNSNFNFFYTQTCKIILFYFAGASYYVGNIQTKSYTYTRPTLKALQTTIAPNRSETTIIRSESKTRFICSRTMAMFRTC